MYVSSLIYILNDLPVTLHNSNMKCFINLSGEEVLNPLTKYSRNAKCPEKGLPIRNNLLIITEVKRN